MSLGPSMPQPSRVVAEAIPETLNIFIAAAGGATAVILLWTASHSESPIGVALSVIAFSFVGNTLFSCLHECVHGVFHSRRWVNESAGSICAAFFPTGLSLQRAAHLGHHRRNRTRFEMFDYYSPGDSRVLKTIQWYGIISGVYWAVVVLGWLLYLVLPFAFSAESRESKWSDLAEHTSGPAYLRSFSAAPPLRSRLELLGTIAFQALIFQFLNLTVTGWLLCYVAFGLQWSALQYADHAFAPLDVVEGAWDLRVHPWVQAVFLNYHLHLAHHRHPTMSWIHLPQYVDESKPRPRFLVQYARMWRGPRPQPDVIPISTE
jgi:fatty acid desaturase